MKADPVLVEKFRRLLTGEEKGYAANAWDELARVAAEHYSDGSSLSAPDQQRITQQSTRTNTPSALREKTK